MNIKANIRKFEYELMKECFDEIAPDLNFRLEKIDTERKPVSGDACDAESDHVIRLETSIERWNELMDYCTDIEKEIFDEKGNSRFAENSPEYKRYEKFDRLWSLMFYIGDMYGIA
ncbi:MAG: hypothetical protein IJO77_05960 [Oscillospiraceae bacterium]|nr:hypothetical protein [Oscillospiraceae bacterium]